MKITMLITELIETIDEINDCQTDYGKSLNVRRALSRVGEIKGRVEQLENENKYLRGLLTSELSQPRGKAEGRENDD